ETPLGGIVGVEVTGGAGDVDAVPAEQYANAADEIDRRDDRPRWAVRLPEGANPRRLALAPEPHLRGRLHSFLNAPLVRRVIGEDRLRRFHQADEDLAARPLRQVIRHRLVGDVVRRLTLRPGERRRLRLPAPHQDVAVLHAGVELDDAAGDLLSTEFMMQ